MAVVCEVKDILSQHAAVPAHATLLCLALRKHNWPHALGEGTDLLFQIDDVELVFDTGHHVLHTEEEPLSVAVRIDIVAQQQVV